MHRSPLQSWTSAIACSLPPVNPVELLLKAPQMLGSQVSYFDYVFIYAVSPAKSVKTICVLDTRRWEFSS